MMNKAKAVLFLTASFLACTSGGEASLSIDTRAIQALRSGLDPTTGELQVSCVDGRSITVPVTVDDTARPITIYVPACGPARIDFNILSTVGVPELIGGADTVLRPGSVQVDIDVRYVGQLVLGLDAASIIDTCTATLERLTPDPEVVRSDLALTKAPTTLLVPVGSYRVTCEGDRLLDTQVTAGTKTTGALTDPIPGPRLASTDLQPSYAPDVQSIDVNFTFTVPVRGVDVSSVLINGGTASVAQVTGSGTAWRAIITGLSIGESYTITLTPAISDFDGLPLVGAPVVLPFRVRVNEYYLSTTGSDANDGSSPAQAWRSFDTALAGAVQPALIMVAAGTYDESVFMPPNVTLEGGWAPDFSVRDLRTHISRIRAVSRPISFTSISGGTTLDGLWIEGTLTDIVVVIQGASPRIVNCVILGSGIYASLNIGYGMFIENGAQPLVANNVFSVLGGGTSARVIHVQNGGSVVLVNNTIQGGPNDVFDVYLDSTGYDAIAVNNLFLAGTNPTMASTGIFAENAPSTVVGNAFAADVDQPFVSIGTTLAIGNGDFGAATPLRYGGNAIDGANSSELVSGTDLRTTAGATSLGIGIDASTATCGLQDTSAFPCDGPTTDRFGAARTLPITVGAYEL